MFFYITLVISGISDEFINVPVTINITNTKNTLAIDLANFGDKPFSVSPSKNIPVHRINESARLHRNGSRIAIKTGGYYICTKTDNEISRCNQPEYLWDISTQLEDYNKSTSIGYYICLTNGKCIIVEDDKIYLEISDEPTIFDFKLLPNVYNCLYQFNSINPIIDTKIRKEALKTYLETLDSTFSYNNFFGDLDDESPNVVKTLSGINKSPKAKEILEKLHKNSWKFNLPSINKPKWFNMFCPLR